MEVRDVYVCLLVPQIGGLGPGMCASHLVPTSCQEAVICWCPGMGKGVGLGTVHCRWGMGLCLECGQVCVCGLVWVSGCVHVGECVPHMQKAVHELYMNPVLSLFHFHICHLSTHKYMFVEAGASYNAF